MFHYLHPRNLSFEDRQKEKTTSFMAKNFWCLIQIELKSIRNEDGNYSFMISFRSGTWYRSCLRKFEQSLPNKQVLVSSDPWMPDEVNVGIIQFPLLFLLSNVTIWSCSIDNTSQLPVFRVLQATQVERTRQGWTWAPCSSMDVSGFGFSER